ncbi:MULTISPECIES: DNA internalization-related competence protein ComEC/Rec2 [Paenibacillus]|uniref:DNA internalization-related competence protein ComEC/Rec2 n=1 Tax=Paenibacillus TaxID=44249 RepID=UPI0022B8EB1C|nr:DNA internalization-related competence protein ComEC/Rec2 [Paenibacillus caseinilyticus]MCZ8518677.1 DNA internalization-related competence protein ComEC/Rec2 [Paenibacillus caseinilyticus]
MLQRRPVVLAAAGWASGCIAADLWPQPWYNLLLVLGAGLLLCLVMALKPPGALWLAGLLIAGAGMGWYGEHDRKNVSRIRVQGTEEPGAALQGRIVTAVTVDGDRVSFQVLAEEVTVPAPGAVRDGGRGERLQVSVRLAAQAEQKEAMGWARGDLIGLQGKLAVPSEARNFGGFDYRDYLYHQGVHWLVTTKGLGEVEVVPPKKGDWGAWLPLRWNDTVRTALGTQVERLFPAEQTGFMQGMLVGLTDAIDPEQFDRFSQLGLTHIIAISGLNVAIFVGCLVWLLKRCGLTREATLLTALYLMPLYIAVTGGSPSIVRAGLMAMIALYAAYRHRLKDGLHIALIAGVGMLVWNPYYLTDVSFQLSFLVTLGLIAGVPAMNAVLPARLGRLRDAVSITLVAQLMSFPLTIYYFNGFSLLSLPANFVMVPVFSTFVMPAGTVAMLLGFLSPMAAGWISWLVAKVNGLLFAVVAWCAEGSFFQTIWRSPSPLWIAGYYAVLLLLIRLVLEHRRREEETRQPQPLLFTTAEEARRRLWQRWNRRLVRPGAAAALAGLLLFAYLPEQGGQEGRVEFLDVGQGDSILIRLLPAGRTVLVDGGGTVAFGRPGEDWRTRQDPYEVGRKLLVPLLKKRGVRQIDELIVTHQDADHYGGLQAVLEGIPVKRLLFNGTMKPEAGVEKLFRTALERGTKLAAVGGGDRLELGEDTVLYFLHPHSGRERGPIETEEDQNPNSVVFLMEMQGTRWLFTGDIGQETERALLEQWGEGGAASAGGLPSSASGKPQPVLPGRPEYRAPLDVLKVAHHGSKSSTSDTWLAAWQPKHAVISAGVNNMYGHPSPAVLDRLAGQGTAVYRTDRQGEIQMAVREGRIYMRTRLGAIRPDPAGK